jgi:hypothetical protein
MKGIYVAEFGKDKEGVSTYRINGEKEDLLIIIKEAKDLGFSFWEKPILEKAHKHYSVLLKLYIPRDMNYPDELQTI